MKKPKNGKLFLKVENNIKYFRKTRGKITELGEVMPTSWELGG